MPSHPQDVEVSVFCGSHNVAVHSAGYYAYLNVADKLGLNKPGKKKTKSTGPKAIDHDEWIKGTSYEVSKRRKATQRNTGGKAVTAS